MPAGILMAWWCILNVVVQRDRKDNIDPTKKKIRGRIDPVVAARMECCLSSIDGVTIRPGEQRLGD